MHDEDSDSADDEVALFRRAMGDARPLKQEQRATAPKPKVPARVADGTRAWEIPP